MKKFEFVLYGLDKHKEVVNKIIKEINDSANYFDINLLLSEALTNAYVHGNKKDKALPIYLRVMVKNDYAVFEIEDSGVGFVNVQIPEEISEEDLLKEHGRGLFLINCFADKVEFVESTLIIEKALSK